MKNLILAMLPMVLGGCASGAANPGATLWAGLNNYHEEMRTLEAMPDRWPDRQRLAQSVQTTYLATLGGSREFNRLIELDLRRRELLIAQRSGGLKVERAREIDQEVVSINEQIDALIGIVKKQLMNAQLGTSDSGQAMETVATLGLLDLAIDAFSSGSRQNPEAVASVKVGPYTVIDQGMTSLVTNAEGQTFVCTTTLIDEEGASIQCRPSGGKS